MTEGRPVWRIRGLPLAIGLSVLAWAALFWLLPWKVIGILMLVLVSGCVAAALASVRTERWSLLPDRPDRVQSVPRR